MTSYSPRIYLYKITFEEVPYYYYGIHKEKRFGEKYLGSPYTNKWCWELYTPKKQILQIFDYTDEGWVEASKIETRLIKPFFNTDKWCLNESCGGIVSLSVLKNNQELKLGVHGRTKEEMSAHGKMGGDRVYELGIGIHSLSKEERIKNGKISGKKGGNRTYELGVGIFKLSKEEIVKNAKNGAKMRGKITTSQRWQCTVTGHISTPGGLSNYQKARGIDTSKRIKLTL